MHLQRFVLTCLAQKYIRQSNWLISAVGKVGIDDTLFVYYGGADKYVGLATCKLNELMEYLLSCQVTE